MFTILHNIKIKSFTHTLLPVLSYAYSFAIEDRAKEGMVWKPAIINRTDAAIIVRARVQYIKLFQSSQLFHVATVRLSATDKHP
jgi:hypothetical protein